MKRFLNIFIFLLFLFYFSLFTFHLKAQWVQQSLPVNKPITGIEFVDTLHGWACTSRGNPPDTGYILYTSNGGTNWLVQFKQYDFAFADIDMVNSLTGYSGGFLYTSAIPLLYKTTNGGLNWVNLNININHFVDDIFFVNASSGWTCNALFGPDVRTTTDGGNTWTLRISGITQQTNKLFFLNYDTGFCGASGIFYRTTNAGATWSLVTVFSEDIGSIFFFNLSTGWLGCSNMLIRFTSNGGINWTNQPNPQYFNTIRAIFFINLNTGWAGGGLDYIYKTTNGGQSWGYQIDFSGSTHFSFSDSLHGWSSGTSSVRGICHTTNGGGPIMGITTINNKIPRNFYLYQNYPNPFNPTTNIEFDITKSSFAKLIVYNSIGSEITILINTGLKPGKYKADWNAENFSSGLYFYKLIIDNKFIDTKKMILIK